MKGTLSYTYLAFRPFHMEQLYRSRKDFIMDKQYYEN